MLLVAAMAVSLAGYSLLAVAGAAQMRRQASFQTHFSTWVGQVVECPPDRGPDVEAFEQDVAVLLHPFAPPRAVPAGLQ